MITEDQLREAHAAAIRADLDRDALLAAFDPHIARGLREANSDTAAFWSDLCSLHQTGPALLGTWLRTAADQASLRPEAKVFRELLAALEGPASGGRRAWKRAWVGREAEMKQLVQALATPRSQVRAVAICAVQGMGGVGKTYLAERFAWERAASFPGGVRRLAMRPGSAPGGSSAGGIQSVVSTLLGQLASQLRVPSAQAAQLRALLQATGSLVHVDNADDHDTAEAAAALARELAGCPLIVTGRHRALGEGADWAVVRVAPFDEATALAQLEAEIDRAIAPGERGAFAELSEALGYLPLALSLAAAHVREGMGPREFLTILREDRLNRPHPDPARGDEDPARRNLARTFELSLGLLRRDLGEREEGTRLPEAEQIRAILRDHGFDP